MKIIGLDVGEKRIGIAKVDSSTRIAIPVGFANVDGTEFEQIIRVAKLNDTKFFVIGLPRSNEGNETMQSLYSRNFAKTLTEKIPGAKIHFQDESLTSVEAEKRLKSRKKSYEKGEIDAEAASIILQDFVEHFSEKQASQNSSSTNLIEKNTKKAMLKSKKAVHKSKKLAKIIVTPISLFVIAIIAVGCLFWYKNSLSAVAHDCAIDDCSEISFPINDGDSVSEIAENLKNAGLINSSFFFKVYMKISRSDTVLKSGNYSLNKSLSVSEIVDMLEAGTKDSNVFSFTIIPGENIFSIKKKLIAIGYSEDEINDALRADYDNKVLEGKPLDKTIEGYLLGETHEFYKETPVKQIFEEYIKDLEFVVDTYNLKEAYKKQGLTLYEGIVLASIVQKEAYTNDQPTVAQVFLKRLNNNIALGSDVTVSYAVDIVDPDRKTYTSNADALNIDSCYNTRKYAGLPCGAISNPSMSALKAVAEPTDTDYLFFLTGDDGKMYYSYTEAEHNQNARDHCQVLCNISL